MKEYYTVDLVSFVVGSDDPEEQEAAPKFVEQVAERLQKLLG